jgi:hypothetical protein
MLFDDIRRTEAFALMARPRGGSARSTLLQRSGAWWSILRNTLKTTNGKRSWALFCACVVNVLAFLAISPLSSSLLTSLDVQIHRATEFSSIVPTDSTIALRPKGDTFFRTISNLLQNVTTSAFIADPYLVFPSHPSTIRQAPLGARLSDNASTWHTRSLVYQLEYDCVSAQVSSKNDTPYSLRLETPSCPYQINMSLLVSDDFLAKGGSVWTNLNYTASSNDTKSTKPDCDQNVDIIIMTTPWMYQGLKEPQRLESNGTLKAHVCNTKVYQDLSTVVVTNSPTMSRVDINQTSFKSQRQEVSTTTLDISELRHLLVDSRWSNYLSEPLRDAGSKGGLLPRGESAVYQGAAAALGAFYNWNFTMMLEAPDIVSRTRQVQRRLFGELLQVSVMQPDASEIVTHSGTIVETERRIVVVPQVAITLIALLGLSIVLMSVVFFMSRLFKRPLYLTQDPATVIGLADRLPLIDPSPNLHNLSLASKKDIESRLQHDTYQNSPGRSSAATIKDHEETYEPSALHSQWKPTSLRLWNLVLVLLYIIAILVAVSVLYHFAVRNKLYKTAFVYRATIHMLQSAKFAPYSILPTLLAVGVELVWDSIESTIRRLQPYLSMTKKPTPIKDGSGLSYQSSYLAWSALKALKHKHWLLAMISTGSVVCKICKSSEDIYHVSCLHMKSGCCNVGTFRA